MNKQFESDMLALKTNPETSQAASRLEHLVVRLALVVDTQRRMLDAATLPSEVQPLRVSMGQLFQTEFDLVGRIRQSTVTETLQGLGLTGTPTKTRLGRMLTLVSKACVVTHGSSQNTAGN